MEELGVRPHHFDAGRMQHNGEFYDEISGRQESISLLQKLHKNQHLFCSTREVQNHAYKITIKS